jgi:hypothetical protein
VTNTPWNQVRGGDILQTERGAVGLQGAQSVPDLLADARPYQASRVRHRRSALAIFYSLFVDYYVSSLTGAVKE